MDHHTMCPHCGQLIGAKPEPCPDCKGTGLVSDSGSNGSGSWFIQKPCPRGCPTAYLINYAPTFTWVEPTHTIVNGAA